MKLGHLLGIVLAFYGGLCAAMACWTDRTLDFWLTVWKGTEVDVNWWLSFLVTCLLAPVVLTINVISEVLRAAMF